MLEAAHRLELHDRILRNIEFGPLKDEMARYAEKARLKTKKQGKKKK